MKLAVFGESPADEAAIRILVEGLLGQPAEQVDLPSLRSRGWQSVCNLLPTVLRALHYQTDADLLAIVLDSDRSPVHVAEHEQPGKASAKCRLCQVREVAKTTQGHLRERTGRPPLWVAIGLAVPCIEAWYRCGHDPHVTEAAWIQALQVNKYPYDGPPPQASGLRD
jgi:hypothetical protein